MIEAAARAKRVGMTAFNWRFSASMLRFHDMVQAGHVGRPFHLGGRWLGARWADESAASTWRMDRAQAGHGAMGDMGVHLVDLVRWSFGEFRQVAALGRVAHPSRTVPGGERAADAEDYCAVLGELASGATVTLQASRAARGANENSLEAYGDKGALVYRMNREAPRWWHAELRATQNGGGLQPVKVPAVVPRSAGDGDAMESVGKATIAPLVKRLLAAIRKGESASPSFEDGLRAQAVLDAVLESERRGDWVTVAGG